MDLRDLQPFGKRHRLRVDVAAADHHDVVGAAPQRIAARGLERRFEARCDQHARRGEVRIAASPRYWCGLGSGLTSVDMIRLAPHHDRLACRERTGNAACRISAATASSPPRPITPFSATAAIRTICIRRRSAEPCERIAARRANGPLIQQHARRAICRIRSRACSSRAPTIRSAPSRSSTQRCARCTISPLPMPLPRCSGRTNRSSR